MKIRLRFIDLQGSNETEDYKCILMAVLPAIHVEIW